MSVERRLNANIRAIADSLTRQTSREETATTYTLIPGRCLMRNGRPLVSIVKAGYTTKEQADTLAQRITELLNQAEEDANTT